MGRVDRERREHREDLVVEHLAHGLLLVDVEVAPAQDLDSRLAQGRHEVVERLGVLGHQGARAVVDALHQLARRQSAGRLHGDAGGDASLQPGDANHVELVEVAGEDRQELGPLKWWDGGVLGELEHALVERQPRQLSVGETVGRVAARAGRRTLCSQGHLSVRWIHGDRAGRARHGRTSRIHPVGSMVSLRGLGQAGDLNWTSESQWVNPRRRYAAIAAVLSAST